MKGSTMIPLVNQEYLANGRQTAGDGEPVVARAIKTVQNDQWKSLAGAAEVEYHFIRIGPPVSGDTS